MMHVTVLATTFIVPVVEETPAAEQPAPQVAKPIPAAPVKEQKKVEAKPAPVAVAVVETKKRT